MTGRCMLIHKKCFVMRLTHARHLTRFNCILGDTSFQETDNHPYLGVHITKDLTWNKHIHQITATANRTLAFVIFTHAPNIIKNLPTQLLFVHFLNIHHPYGTPHTKTLVNKIEMVQRRAARFCHNDYKTIEKV